MVNIVQRVCIPFRSCSRVLCVVQFVPLCVVHRVRGSVVGGGLCSAPLLVSECTPHVLMFMFMFSCSHVLTLLMFSHFSEHGQSEEEGKGRSLPLRTSLRSVGLARSLLRKQVSAQSSL